jgi:hypothetical protein
VYHERIERLNRFPQGAPPPELLQGILKMLFSEEEAKPISLLLIRPFRTDKAAKHLRMPERKADDILQGLAGRGEATGSRLRARARPLG